MNKKTTTETNDNKRTHLGFYLVLALCAVMIGVSCWFAYTQTADDLTIQLESALDSAGNMAAAQMESRADETEPAATTAQAAAYIPPSVQETTEAPSAATMPATTAAPQTHTETVTEAVSAEIPIFPVTGDIIGAFSNGELVKSETTGVWQTHNGIDIACTAGDEVRAMASGVISSVEEDPLWGICVTIDHENGMFSRYCSLNPGLAVGEGDHVTGGTVIGAAGGTADIESSMDTHLHFEVLQGETYLDPVSYISGE